jgi:hypothetical protein
MLLLAGCNLAAPAPDALTPVATVPNVRIASVDTPAPQPTTLRLVQAVETPAATATPAATTAPTSAACVPQPERRPRHTVTATLDYAAKTATVTQQIDYPNTSGARLLELVLNVEAHRWDNAFALQTARLGTEDVTATLQGNRMIVPLPQPLEPDCAAVLTLDFTVRPPRVGSGLAAFRGFFGYGERQMNLAYWLPVVAPIVGTEWLIREPDSIGEQAVLAMADWDVTLTVDNASGDLKIAAPADEIEQLAPNRWRYQFYQARDFAISLSEVFRVQSVTTPGGVVVEMYSFPDAIRPNAVGQTDSALFALQEAARALQQYSDLFGPYPHRRMVIVQGDFPDGMEFSGLVFVSTNWFYQYEGGVRNFLTVITVHEVSHQWWYARVGNDPALAPWLDEALATYSEYIYYEEYYPELKNWWWDFRVGWYNPTGSVDSTVYEFDNVRDYINAVYLRGVQMLHNIREDVGTEAFFRLLADYARAGSGQIATPALFWSLLTPEQFAATRDTRGQFLSQPEIFSGSP